MVVVKILADLGELRYERGDNHPSGKKTVVARAQVAIDHISNGGCPEKVEDN